MQALLFLPHILHHSSIQIHNRHHYYFIVHLLSEALLLEPVIIFGFVVLRKKTDYLQSVLRQTS